MMVTMSSEYQVANLFQEHKRELSAKDHLLDHATDGFCEVDVASGAVLGASPQLKRTILSGGKLESAASKQAWPEVRSRMTWCHR